jgi:DNA-binding CsgD family transcriptional regulator
MPHQAPADRSLPLRPLATPRDTAAARRQQVLELALAGHDPAAIAQTLGISRRTVERALAASRELLHDLRRQRLQHIADRLATEAETAITVLGQVAQDDTAPPAARVAAAKAVLGELRAYVETVDLTERLTAVERRLADARAAADGTPTWAPAPDSTTPPDPGDDP